MKASGRPGPAFMRRRWFCGNPKSQQGEGLFYLMSRLTSLRRFKRTEAAGGMLELEQDSHI